MALRPLSVVDDDRGAARVPERLGSTSADPSPNELLDPILKVCAVRVQV